MEPLETMLRTVEDLRKDLSAEIVLQEEKSYYETVECASLAGNIWDEWTEQKLVISQPRITEPDEAKRESARTQLQQMYDSSEWYSARYVAGSLIGEDAARNVKNWYADFEKRLGATRTEKREVREWRQETEMVGCGKGGSDTRDTSHWETVLKTFEIIDAETRRNALVDAIQLLKISNLPEIQELLKNEYSNNTSDYVRVEAGKALGYGPMKIWAHEHPVAATVTGIAAAGATSGLGYILYQYFSK